MELNFIIVSLNTAGIKLVKLKLNQQVSICHCYREAMEAMLKAPNKKNTVLIAELGIPYVNCDLARPSCTMGLAMTAVLLGLKGALVCVNQYQRDADAETIRMTRGKGPKTWYLKKFTLVGEGRNATDIIFLEIPDCDGEPTISHPSAVDFSFVIKQYTELVQGDLVPV